MAQGYVYDDAAGWRHIQAGDIPSGGGSPLTTKGDLYGFDTANKRVPVGADTQVLTADSTQALGVKWAAAPGGAPSGPAGGSLAGTYPNPSVANSGVAAATYGDSTHTAQVTVGVDGRVTNASSVAISGSAGAGGLVTLYDSGFLGGAVASIDTGAGGIASGHGILIAFLLVRTADVATTVNLSITVNNDSSALYQEIRTRGSNVTTTTANFLSQTAWNASIAPGASATANRFGYTKIEIPFYDSGATLKVGDLFAVNASSTAAQATVDHMGIGYESLSAISRMAVASASGGNIAAGSRLLICGTQ